MATASSAYRPEIDGLRAIAVLGVLVFHLSSSTLPGGFVGVDVFFVISGFLITKIIVTQLMNEGTFSYGQFYMRRVRRLFPALFVTLLATTLVAYKLLPPTQLQRFAGALSHAVVSLSNFYFWGESGYFDVSAATKPLLHTWSLSVEEQFYLVWPVSLVLAHKLHRRFGALLWVLTTIVLSLGLNLWVLGSSPSDMAILGEDRGEIQSGVFFLTPFRMFELALGGLGCFLLPYVPRRPVVTIAATALGLLAIFYAYTQYSDQMEFPSTPALVPCVGTLLILLARPTGRDRYLLGAAPLSWIGKASYSIYLVHWPLYVLLQIWIYRPLTQYELVAVFALSIALGGLMYRFVEQPFRHPAHQGQPNTGFATGAACLSLALCFVAGHMWGNAGWPFRFDLPEGVQTEVGGSTWNRIKALDRPLKEGKGQGVLLLGDSQMADFINIAEQEMTSRKLRLRSWSMRAECVPYLAEGQAHHMDLAPRTPWGEGWPQERVKKVCPGTALNLRKLLEKEKFDRVIVGLLWQRDHRPYIEGMVKNLEHWAKAPVALVGNKELRGSPLPLDSPLIANHCVGRTLTCAGTSDINRFGRSYLGSREATVSDYLANFSHRQKLPFFDFESAMCSAEACLIYLESGIAVYKDKGHFNKVAFEGVTKHVKRPLQAFLDQVSSQEVPRGKPTKRAKTSLDPRASWVKVETVPEQRSSFATMQVGVRQHLDRKYTYDVVPPPLLGGLLYQGLHRPPEGLEVSITLERPARVFFFFHPEHDGGYGEIFAKLEGWSPASPAPQYDLKGGTHGMVMELYVADLPSGVHRIPATTKARGCFSIVFDFDSGS